MIFNPPNIINDLTTGGATNALSAEQGKVLNSKVNELTTYGVVSGLDVSPQTVPNMTVQVSAGVVYMPDFTRYSISAVASIAIDAADVTDGRYDIIYVNSSGVVSYLAGTPAETPVAPSTPVGGVLLAIIYVAANATEITSAQAYFKETLGRKNLIAPTLLNGHTGTQVYYWKGNDGFVRMTGRLAGGSSDYPAFQLAEGYRIAQPTDFPIFTDLAGATGRIKVQSNGNVYAISNTRTHMNLCTVAFYAEG